MTAGDFGLGLVAFGLLALWNFRWVVVVLSALGGEVPARIPGGDFIQQTEALDRADHGPRSELRQAAANGN